MEEEKMQSFFGDGYADYQKASADAKTESLKKLTDDDKAEIKTLIKQNPSEATAVFKGMDAYLVQAPTANLVTRQLSNGAISLSLLHKSAVWVSCMFQDPVTAEGISEGIYCIIYGKYKLNEKDGNTYHNFVVHDVLYL